MFNRRPSRLQSSQSSLVGLLSSRAISAAKRGAVYQFIGWNYQAASPGRLPFPLLRDHPALRTPQGAGVKKEGRPAELGSLRVVSHLNQPLQLVGSADRREEKNI